jgi:hypothetical protein
MHYRHLEYTLYLSNFFSVSPAHGFSTVTGIGAMKNIYVTTAGLKNDNSGVMAPYAGQGIGCMKRLRSQS